MCHKDYSDKHKENRHIIDLRGCSVEDAIKKLIQRLNDLVTETGWLYARVGCETHGIGEGKLKKPIIALLQSDETIEFVKDYSKSLVSITLDGRGSYSSLGDVHVYDELFDNDDDFFLLSDSDGEDEGGLRYVVTCDLIFVGTYPSLDEQSSQRVECTSCKILLNLRKMVITHPSLKKISKPVKEVVPIAVASGESQSSEMDLPLYDNGKPTTSTTCALCNMCSEHNYPPEEEVKRTAFGIRNLTSCNLSHSSRLQKEDMKALQPCCKSVHELEKLVFNHSQKR